MLKSGQESISGPLYQRSLQNFVGKAFRGDTAEFCGHVNAFAWEGFTSGHLVGISVQILNAIHHLFGFQICRQLKFETKCV